MATANVSRRTVRIIDAMVLGWTAAWVAVGVWVGTDVHQLARLSVTLGAAAGALHQTGEALHTLSSLPLVGGDLGRLAQQIDQTARTAAANSSSSKSSVDQLAYLLAVVIASAPVVPALAAYLPFRIQRVRELRAVRAALATPGSSLNLRRYLANRALANLPYHQLLSVSADPWGDVQNGQLDALAGAELARLGIDRHRLDAEDSAYLPLREPRPSKHLR